MRTKKKYLVHCGVLYMLSMGLMSKGETAYVKGISFLCDSLSPGSLILKL